MNRLALLALAALAGLTVGCSRAPKPDPEKAEMKTPPAQEVPQPKPPEPAAPPKQDAGVFRVRFETTKGPFVLEVHPDWAPLGAERFRQLVEDKFFDGARFFRVLPNFVVQFGLAANPALTRKWDKPIQDDPVKQTNALGTIVFATAGPATRTTQLFINVRSNQALDADGFSPFGKVIEGLEAVTRMYPGYGEAPDQGRIMSQGNAYLTAQFPELDSIRTARIVK